MPQGSVKILGPKQELKKAKEILDNHYEQNGNEAELYQLSVRLYGVIERLLSRIEELEKENERFRKALKFYADESSYVDYVAGTEITPTVLEDKGQIAQNALKESEKNVRES